jgi:hypothetical protein
MKYYLHTFFIELFMVIIHLVIDFVNNSKVFNLIYVGNISNRYIGN